MMNLLTVRVGKCDVLWGNFLWQWDRLKEKKIMVWKLSGLDFCRFRFEQSKKHNKGGILQWRVWSRFLISQMPNWSSRRKRSFGIGMLFFRYHMWMNKAAETCVVTGMEAQRWRRSFFKWTTRSICAINPNNVDLPLIPSQRIWILLERIWVN